MVLPDGSMFLPAPPPLQQQAQQQRQRKLTSLRGRLGKQGQAADGEAPAAAFAGSMAPYQGLPPLMLPMMPQLPFQLPPSWQGEVLF